MYINRIRPHDADIKRREYALNRAFALEGVRSQFIDWCLKQPNLKQEDVSNGLNDLETLIVTWRQVADQNKID